MRLVRPASLLVCSLLIPASVPAQPPPRDPRAVVLLQQSYVTMGGVLPRDSLATGTVTLVEGSTTANGTVRLLTRGLDQNLEEIQTLQGRRAIVHSRGRAQEQRGGATKEFSLELVSSSQPANFPLVLLAAILNNPDSGFQYVGIETLSGVQAHHLRVWNTFYSHPEFQSLAQFSPKDLWLDVSSGLFRKAAYSQRAARGAVGPTRVEIFFLEYRIVAGVLYPFRIEKSLNGTPWASITIATVNLNSGLSDADFQVR